MVVVFGGGAVWGVFVTIGLTLAVVLENMSFPETLVGGAVDTELSSRKSVNSSNNIGLFGGLSIFFPLPVFFYSNFSRNKPQ